MTAFELHAVVGKATADRIARSRALPDLTIVEALDLAAVMGPAPSGLWRQAGKAALAQRMLAFQRSLEALMPFGPLLPAKPGSLFRDPLEPTAFLIAHAGPLRSALAEMGGLHQIQVLVAWDPAAMLERLRGSARLAPLAAGPDPLDRRGYARALAAIMEQYRAELGRDFAATLRAVTVDMLLLPPDGETGLLNATVLIDPARQAAFDAAVEAIDAVATEALKIKVVGPLPACAFASVTVEKPDRRTVERARRAIGGDEGLAIAELKRRYRERMKLVHPDMPDGEDTAASATTTSYDLLRRIAEAEAALREQGMEPPGLVPLMRVLRADQPGIAA